MEGNMRKSIVLLVTMFTILLMASSALLAKVTVSEKSNSVNYSFEIDGVKFSEKNIAGKKFVKAALEGVENYQGINYKIGYPEIPVIRFYIAARDNSSIKIDYNTSSSKALNSTRFSLAPSLESLPKIAGAKRVLVQNHLFAKSNSVWPTVDYRIDDAGSVKGEMRKLVTLFPFKVNPTTNQYTLIKHFNVEVEKNVAKSIPMRNSDLFVFIVGRTFKNSSFLERYIEFKDYKGYRVERIDVTSSMTADDIREKVQSIWSREGDAFKYAMIVGDSDTVPGHKAKHIKGITDHYYRAIDTDNYENDINGPDIGVGRITVRTENELEVVIDKFIKYQMNDFSQRAWLSKIAFIATTDKYEIAEGSHNHAIDNYTKRLQFTGSFPNRDMAGGDKLYGITYKARGSDVVRAVKEGRAIVNYSGHGSTTSWAGPTVKQRDVRKLKHADANPFVISNACITGKFTSKESFAETWIKHKHGAIMFWGSMDSTYWDEDDILERAMYKGIFANGNGNGNGNGRFADITQYPLGEHWKHYGGSGKSKYYWETYVTFGDPSIQLQMDMPAR